MIERYVHSVVIGSILRLAQCYVHSCMRPSTCVLCTQPVMQAFMGLPWPGPNLQLGSCKLSMLGWARCACRLKCCGRGSAHSLWRGMCTAGTPSTPRTTLCSTKWRACVCSTQRCEHKPCCVCACVGECACVCACAWAGVCARLRVHVNAGGA